MPTLVLSPRYTSDSNRLWQAALSQQWTVERLQTHRAPDDLQDAEVVVYGEGLFVRVIAEQLELALFEAPADWLTQLPNEYCLRDIQFMTLEEARQLSKRAFVKPALDKSFEARVYSSGAELPSSEYADDDTPTLVSEPVEWEIEYRCFIANRQLHTFAPYLRNGELLTDAAGEWESSAPEDDDAAAFLKRLLADDAVKIPPAAVIDVGKIKGRGWAVIEANPAWAAGLYGNHAVNVLEALRYSCMKTDQVAQELQQWIIAG